eukprot:NODE_613_length_5385_cov_1.452138.p2 type:complete len:248 gc:universal NODE_613_length_5385_cov_1.452138:2214-1471(-)
MSVDMNMCYAVVGATILLSIQTTILCFTTLKSKTSKIFISCILSIFCCLAQSLLAIDYLNGNRTEWWYALLISVLFLTYTTLVGLVYVWRVNSLGGFSKLDKYLKYVPIIIFISVLPTNILFIATPSSYILYVVRAFSHFMILACEIFLFSALYYKIEDIMEYRKELRSKLLIQTSISLIFMCLLDVLVIYLHLSGTYLNFVVRPVSHLLRIYILCYFYKQLIEDLNRSYQALQSLQSYHNDSAFVE